MSLCNTCTRVKNLYTCLDTLTVGVGEPEEAYLVFFRNVATGRTIQLSGESDIDGIITVAPPESEIDWLTGSDYEVWVSLTTPENLDEQVTFLINDIEVTCVFVRFERIYNSENITVTGLDQAFELA